MSANTRFSASQLRILERFGTVRTYVQRNTARVLDPSTGEYVDPPGGGLEIEAKTSQPVTAKAGQYPGVDEGEMIWHVDAAPFIAAGVQLSAFVLRGNGPDDEDRLIDLVRANIINGQPTLYLARMRAAGSESVQ